MSHVKDSMCFGFLQFLISLQIPIAKLLKSKTSTTWYLSYGLQKTQSDLHLHQLLSRCCIFLATEKITMLPDKERTEQKWSSSNPWTI
jgi:hypothetical protein